MKRPFQIKSSAVVNFIIVLNSDTTVTYCQITNIPLNEFFNSTVADFYMNNKIKVNVVHYINVVD